MLWRKSYLSGICFLLLWMSRAQDSLQGRLRDTSAVPVAGAYILSLDPQTAKLEEHTFSGPFGRFRVFPEGRDTVRIRVSALGFKPLDTVLVKPRHDPWPYLELGLASAPTPLDEVVVMADRPIHVRRDTVEFRVDAFLRGTEQVAEEVLKRLPGVEVSKTGEIRVRGKPVQKVLIEGDDLMDKKYRILTRNLDASVLEKVQVLQAYQANPLLRGIRNTEAVAINLKLKAAVRGHLSGTLSAGGGFPSRYDLRSNTLYLRKKTKMYVLGTANTIGKDPLGDVYTLMHPVSETEDPMPGEGLRTRGVYTPALPPQDLDVQDYIANRASVGSVNSVFNPLKDVKVRARLLATSDKRKILQGQRELFRAGGAAFINETTANQRLYQHYLSGQVEVTCALDGRQRLSAIQEWDASGHYGLDDLVFNGRPNLLRQQLSLERRVTDIRYTLRLDSTAALGVDARILHEQRQSGLVFDGFSFDQFLGVGHPEWQSQQGVQSRLAYNGVRAVLDINKKRWSLQSGLQWDRSGRRLQAALRFSGVSGFASGWPSRAANQRKVFTVWLRSRRKGRRLRLDAGLRLRRLQNIFSEGTSTRIAFWALEPRLGWKWHPGDGHTLRGSYSYEVLASHFDKQWSGPLLSGYRSLKAGIGRFFQNRIHSLSLGYVLGNWGDRNMLNMTALFKREPEYLGMGSLQPGPYSFVFSEPQEDRNTASINLNLDHYLPTLSSNVKLRLIWGSSGYENRVNGVLRRIRSRNVSLGGEWRSAFGGGFECHGGLLFSRMWTRTGQRFFADTFRGFLDLEYQRGSKWAGTLNGEVYAYSGLSRKPVYLAELALNHRPDTGRFQYRLVVENLLNMRTYGLRNVQDTGFYESYHVLQPRRVLLEVRCRL